MEDRQAYFARLLQEIQSKPESYHVLHYSGTELTIEELGEQGQVVQRKYTAVTGEIGEVVKAIEGYNNDNSEA